MHPGWNWRQTPAGSSCSATRAAQKRPHSQTQPGARVDLPHDWSIESRPDKDSLSGAGGGFFPGGVGWYRKTFSAPAEWRGKRVSVEFDGVYKDATVYLNGRKLGTHPYGYTSFAFDLTPGVNFSAPNVLAVRVDNSALAQQPLVQRVRNLPPRPRSRHRSHACDALGSFRHNAEGHGRVGDGLHPDQCGQRIGRIGRNNAGDYVVRRCGTQSGHNGIDPDDRSRQGKGSRANDHACQTFAVVACFAHHVPSGCADTA